MHAAPASRRPRQASVLAGAQRRRRAERQGHGFPTSNGSDAFPCPRGVSDARESPAQLDRSRALAALIQGGANRRSLFFGDDEHRWSMGMQSIARKPIDDTALVVDPRRLST
jgi:hypothetical protein